MIKRLGALLLVCACAATMARAEPPQPVPKPLRPLGPALEFKPRPPMAWGEITFTRAAPHYPEPPGPPPPMPEKHPRREAKGPAREPAPVARRDQPADPPKNGWTAAEIAQAKEICAQLLASATLDHSPADPIKDGVCGAPAPILVRSIGSNPKIELSPPPIMTCTMAVALDQWARDVMQPMAKEHLKTQIVRLQNASSYACRNRYGARGGRLSEHAKANAFDIRAFETAAGDTVSVKEDWSGGGSPKLPWRNPLRAAASALTGSQSGKGLFLSEVHAGACHKFGTVLGPESNAAHRDHFHFDMIERRTGYCR